MLPYLLLFIVVIFLAKLGQNKRIFRIILFIVMTLFVGLRKGVGTDYEEYSKIFYFQGDYLEIGFTYILLYLNKLNLSETWLFFVIAAISYLFMYLAVEKTFVFRQSLVLAMLPLLSLTFLCNGIRQGLAICVFLYAFHFIQERRALPYFTCIAFAFLFHKSILVAIPLYYLSNYKLSKSIYTIIYLLSFVFCTIDLNSLLSPISHIIDNNNRYSNLMTNDSGLGYFSLGVFLEMTNYIILMFLATRNEVFKKYPTLYNMVFIAAILMNMRVGAPLMNRVLTTFSWFCYPMILIVLKSVSPSYRNLFKFYFIFTYSLSAIKYIFFDPNSMMYPYHDALNIF